VLSKEQYQIEKLRAATSRNLELTIHNERRILELVEGTLLKGTIDRLVLVEDDSHVVAAEIIDYKTDFFELFQTGTNLEEWIRIKKLRHREQLMMYRDSISRMYQLPKDRIAMTLMLLSADVVVSIED
jgi:ATP-dependent exoDNAse (exonuclease V) beta subunit